MFETIFGIVFIIVFLFLFFWPISIPLTIIYLVRRSQSKKKFKSMVINDRKSYTEISPSRLEGFDINDLEKLKLYLYDKFYKFELAYNSLDYNSMYNLCTEKLYNLYHTSITLNLKFDEKKIIDQTRLERMIIYDAYSNQTSQFIYTVVEVSNVSYSIKSNGKVISGNPTRPINETFEVIFVKYFKQDNKHKCPNCGAKLENDSIQTCQYCRSNITRVGNRWIISKKKSTRQ